MQHVAVAKAVGMQPASALLPAFQRGRLGGVRIVPSAMANVLFLSIAVTGTRPFESCEAPLFSYVWDSRFTIVCLLSAVLAQRGTLAGWGIISGAKCCAMVRSYHATYIFNCDRYRIYL